MKIKNLLFCCSYDGRKYHGYQVQKNALTVTEVLQDAIETVTGKRDGIIGCSRTDSGVHAKEYYFNMHTECSIPPERLMCALNRVLPNDIVITHCKEVDYSFHARYSAKGKQYVYKLYTGEVRNPFCEGLAYYYHRSVDISLLNSSAQHFVGTHDFAGFCNAGSNVADTVRTIWDFSVKEENGFVIFTISGNGFLYNMVRILVGTLLRVNEGKISESDLDKLIASKDRHLAGKTISPCGLYLNKVYYDSAR